MNHNETIAAIVVWIFFFLIGLAMLIRAIVADIRRAIGDNK